MKQPKDTYFEGLNFLRFFSALAIVFYHATLNFQEQFPKAIKMFVHNLPIGVDMFFILSGFLIVYLLLREKEDTGTVSLSKFYIRRALRIFPLYYLIIGIAYVQYHNVNPEIDFSKFLYFAGNFWMISIDKWAVGILNPLWSLCIEEHFYLFIPVLLLLIPSDKIHYLFFSVLFASLVFRAWITATVEYNWMTIYCHTLSRCDLLALGGLVAWYHKKSPVKLRMNTAVFWGWLAYFLLLMTIVDSTDFTNVHFAVFKKYLFALPLLFIFMFTIFNTTEQKTFFNAIKSNRALDYLGKISFGIYMYHSVVGNWFIGVDFIRNSIVLKPLVEILFTVLLSAVSYEIFEKQILKRRTRLEVVKTVPV